MNSQSIKNLSLELKELEEKRESLIHLKKELKVKLLIVNYSILNLAF